jgi:hypothetical protein
MVFASVLIVVAASTAFAQQAPARGERPLPVFQVAAADGTPTASAQLSPESQWLLIYLNPASATSRRLLQAMREWEAPQVATRTVLIVGGTAQEAQAFIERALPDELRSMRWYSDTDRKAWQALNLKGSPVLVGIRDGRTEWSLSGVLADPAALKSVVLTWVR